MIFNMNWEHNKQDIGEVKIGKKVKVKFRCKDDLTHIVAKLSSSCNCAKPKMDYENGILTVTYKAKPLPAQRAYAGFYNTVNKIYIDYVDGERDILKFTAKNVK